MSISTSHLVLYLTLVHTFVRPPNEEKPRRVHRVGIPAYIPEGVTLRPRMAIRRASRKFGLAGKQTFMGGSLELPEYSFSPEYSRRTAAGIVSPTGRPVVGGRLVGGHGRLVGGRGRWSVDGGPRAVDGGRVYTW